MDKNQNDPNKPGQFQEGVGQGAQRVHSRCCLSQFGGVGNGRLCWSDIRAESSSVSGI